MICCVCMIVVLSQTLLFSSVVVSISQGSDTSGSSVTCTDTSGSDVPDPSTSDSTVTVSLSSEEVVNT